MEVPGNWPMKIHLAREQGGGLSAFWRCTNGPIATGDNSEGPYWIDTDGADRFYAFAWHRTPGGGWYTCFYLLVRSAGEKSGEPELFSSWGRLFHSISTI